MGRIIAVLVVLGLVPASARAFVRGCHDDITTDALAQATWPRGGTPPPLSGDYAYLPTELSVDIASSARNLWAVSVLAGNQYNDQGPYERVDIAALAEWAARPGLQSSHCIRDALDDGDDGDAMALAKCKGYILDQLQVALGSGAQPDLDATEVIRVYLVFRGPADVGFQKFGFHLGQAVHALQDSFSHSFRSPDLKQVRGVLNWVDWLKGGSAYDEARDGFQHISALDNCGASDEGGPERRAAATQATRELLNAIADDSGGREGRLARAGAVIDSWFGRDTSCGAANDWCDAPERSQVGVTGCAVARGGQGAVVWLLVAAAIFSWRRRRGLLLALLIARAASAQESPTDETRGEKKEGAIPKATPSEQRKLVSRPFGTLIKGGFAIDNAAAQVGLGVRYDLNRTWTVGLGLDWSPWLSLDTARTTRGTADIYAEGVFHLDVRDFLELRITAAAGISVMLFDTWAAPSGSVGPYFMISPLGVGFRMNDRLRLLVDPAELVFPVPQMKGIPLIYRQHRLSIALQSNF